MARLNFSPRDVNHAIETKVPGERRLRSEAHYWCILDGKRLFRVTIPKVHSVSSVPPGTLNQIVKSLKLSKPQFGEFVRCPMTGGDYEAFLREKAKAGQI